jgi:hypothetical protein
MLDGMTLEAFEKHLGTAFRVEANPEESQDLTLIEASALTTGPGPSRRDGFSLVFRGPRDKGLEQKIHRLAHDEMGTIDLFLVPLGPEGDPEGTHYQAIFN